MLILSVYKSLLRHIVDAIEDLNTTVGQGRIQYHAWEARADESELPAVPLIGLSDYNFEENDGLWVIRFGIGVSTYRDANLLHEAAILDRLHELTGEGRKVSLLDPTSGALISELVVSAWRLPPMASSEYRNYRVIGVELLRTGLS